jgi:hypothetical protein
MGKKQISEKKRMFCSNFSPEGHDKIVEQFIGEKKFLSYKNQE